MANGGNCEFRNRCMQRAISKPVHICRQDECICCCYDSSHCRSCSIANSSSSTMVRSCCAKLCRNRDTKETREKGLHFYRIPQDPEKRQLWLAAILDPGPNSYICSAHFVGGKFMAHSYFCKLYASLLKYRC